MDQVVDFGCIPLKRSLRTLVDGMQAFHVVLEANVVIQSYLFRPCKFAGVNRAADRGQS